MKLFITTYLIFLILILPFEKDFCTTKILTLDECIKIALEKSYSIKYLNHSIERQKERVKAIRSGLKSNAHINFYLPSYNLESEEVFDSEDDIFKFVNTRKNQLLSNLRINQPIPTNGNFSFNYEFFYETRLENVKNYSNNYFLEFVQPIFTPNRLQMDIKRAELSLRNTELDYESRKLNLIYSITNNFYQLYEQQTLYEIQIAETEQRKQAVNNSREKFRKGEIDEFELIQLQVSYYNSEAELNYRKKYLEKQIGWFKQYIGLFSDDDIRIMPEQEISPEFIDKDAFVQEGLNNSLTLKKYVTWLEFDKLNIIDADKQSEFKGDITVSIGLDRKNPDFTESFSHYDKTNSIVFNFTIPLWDWGRNKAQVASAKAQKKRVELLAANTRKSYERELYESLQTADRSLIRYNNLKKSRVTAQKNYDIVLAKFKTGELGVQELERAQRRLSKAQMSYIDSVSDYKTALSNIERQRKGGSGYVWIYSSDPRVYRR
ncbi:TolC family protein [candidate division KSB1 bacterium]